MKVFLSLDNHKIFVVQLPEFTSQQVLIKLSSSKFPSTRCEAADLHTSNLPANSLKWYNLEDLKYA